MRWQKKPEEVAIINPAVSAHREKTPSQEKPDVVETRPPINETVTGEETPSSEDRVVARMQNKLHAEMDRDFSECCHSLW